MEGLWILLAGIVIGAWLLVAAVSIMRGAMRDDPDDRDDDSDEPRA